MEEQKTAKVDVVRSKVERIMTPPAAAPDDD